MPRNKFNVGELVYYVAMDDNMRWAVFGSTIIAVYRVLGGWEYVVKHKPVNLARLARALYRDAETAKQVAQELNKELTSESTHIQ